MEDCMKKTPELKNNRQGFTIIELIVVLGLASIIMLVGWNIYMVGAKSYKVNQEMTEISESSELLKIQLTQELRQSGNGLIEHKLIDKTSPGGLPLKNEELRVQTYAYSRDSSTPIITAFTYKFENDAYETDGIGRLKKISSDGNETILFEKVSRTAPQIFTIVMNNYYTVQTQFQIHGQYTKKEFSENVTVRGR